MTIKIGTTTYLDELIDQDAGVNEQAQPLKGGLLSIYRVGVGVRAAVSEGRRRARKATVVNLEQARRREAMTKREDVFSEVLAAHFSHTTEPTTIGRTGYAGASLGYDLTF
jgi:hypothetical protein